jgi:hypothetical protein
MFAAQLTPITLRMKIKSLSILALSAVVIAMSSCKDDPVEPEVENEEEVITTVNYTLTPDGGGDDVVLSFQDLDGDGGNAATITNGVLAANTAYTGALELLNEAENPAEDITVEVANEAEHHQFFFETTLVGLNVAYGDTDVDGNPIGLATTVTTTDAEMGTLKITLRHEPIKGATGVSDGEITNAGGETDIEVTFDIDVQ